MPDLPLLPEEFHESYGKLKAQQFDLNTHDLIQQGYVLIDQCCGRTISFNGRKNLTGKKGEWILEDEVVA